MAHAAETDRILCLFEGTLTHWFSLETPQENGKGIILTLKAQTGDELTMGNVSEVIKDALAFLVMTNQCTLRGNGC